MIEHIAQLRKIIWQNGKITKLDLDSNKKIILVTDRTLKEQITYTTVIVEHRTWLT